MKKLQLPQQQTETIIGTLHQTLGENQVYVFGYKDATESFSVFPAICVNNEPKPHFDILVFSVKTYEGLNNTLSDLIAQKSQGTFSATILLHQAKHLKQRAADMNWFFDRVLKYGIPLGEYQLNVSDSLSDLERDIQAADTYWHKCEAVASFYLESATESSRMDVELVKVSLLTQAMEYTLLGLIRIFMGYTPIQYKLRFLFSLCRHFTSLPQKVFDPETDVGKRHLKLLCAPSTMLRLWDRLTLPDDEFESLLDACQDFQEKAEKLALIKLEELKQSFKTVTK